MPEDQEKDPLLPADMRRMNYVIIESNGALRRAMLKVLKKVGVSGILEAESGKDGLMILKANRDIGCVLCTMELPDVNGIKILHQIAQDKKFAETTCIMMMGTTSSEMQQTAKQIGVDAIIQKPFPLLNLRDKVEDAINHRRRKLALKDMSVALDVPARIMVGQAFKEARCVELSRNHCQLISEKELGVGDRLQFRLSDPDQPNQYFEPLRGAVSSATRHENGYKAKIDFMGKVVKVHGVSTLMQKFMPKDI